MTDRDHSDMYRKQADHKRELAVTKLKDQLQRLKKSESFTLDEKRVIEAVIRAKYEGIFE